MYDTEKMGIETVTLNRRQMTRLRDSLNRLDISQYSSYTLRQNEMGEVHLQRWGDDSVSTERVAPAEPKLEVISCIR